MTIFSPREVKLGDIHKMNEEALALINQKKEQIIKIESAIEETQLLVETLMNEISEKENIFNKVSTDTSSFIFEEEASFQALQDELDDKITRLKDEHNAELDQITAHYNNLLQKQIKLSKQNIEAREHECETFLKSITEEITLLKLRFEQLYLSPNVEKESQRKEDARSDNRIKKLENEIARVKSQHENEMKRVKEKIAECTETIQTRKQIHDQKIKMLQKEFNKRKETYFQSITSRRDQLESEIMALDEQIQAEKARAQTIEKLIQLNEELQYDQLPEISVKIEGLKTKKEKCKTEVEIESIVAVTNRLLMKRKSIEGDLIQIQNEISLLENENKELSEEIRKLKKKIK